MATDQFKESMKRCFVDVGLAPYEQTATDSFYRTYTDHKRGSLNQKLWAPQYTLPETGSLGDAIMAVDDMEIITRLDAADDIDGNEGSGNSSSEEDEGLDDE